MPTMQELTEAYERIERHRAHRREYMRAWYAANRDKRNAYRRQLRADKKAAAKEAKREQSKKALAEVHKILAAKPQ
jgi:hypothetical protein